jgi:hypothetical protein
MQKLKPGDLVTLRSFSQIKNKSVIPIFVRVPRDVPDDEGLWQAIGNAYSGDIFIFLEEDPAIHWDGGGWLIQHPESGLRGWVGRKFFKRVR